MIEEPWETEWMDERPWPGPVVQYNFQQTLEVLNQLFRDKYILPLKQIGQAYAHAFQGEELKRLQGLLAAFDDTPTKTAEQQRQELLDARRHRNHGPRSGPTFRSDGKRKW
jgi:hypothetical protein